MKSIWDAEPTLVLAVVSAGLSLAMGFGADITKEQMALVMTFSSAVLGLINRSKVTSPATLQAMTPQTLAKAQGTSEPVKDVIQKLPVLAFVLWASSASAQPYHGHPQLASFDPAVVTLKKVESQCHWAPAERPIQPDADPITFNLAAGTLGNSTLGHTHFGLDVLQCPPYIELTGPRTCNFVVTLFHTTGQAQMIAEYQEGIRDIVWDTTGTSTSPLMIGNPGGVVEFRGHLTLDPTLPTPHGWQTAHGWWMPLPKVGTFYANGDSVDQRLFISYYSMVDPAAPDTGGAPMVGSHCLPGSARHPNDKWGDNYVNVTAQYLPVAPIDKPWQLIVDTAGYGGQLFNAVFEYRADMDLHNGNGGQLLQTLTQTGDLTTSVFLDPAQLGTGAHRVAFLRNQLSSEGNDAVNTLLVFDIEVGPGVPPPPTCETGSHVEGGVCIPDPPPPATWHATATPGVEQFGEQNRFRICVPVGACFEFQMKAP